MCGNVGLVHEMCVYRRAMRLDFIILDFTNMAGKLSLTFDSPCNGAGVVKGTPNNGMTFPLCSVGGGGQVEQARDKAE
eukprot:scaffold18742_cov70-Skeletonema_marinoi.AAC.1